ncbi:hypothetical protein IWX58_000714 [Rubrivivax gelatinosus]|uniref:hypothetical protein n=1 Tax=Rubrivivax gelatinosus TaxID=28068 RepID=UPI0018CAFB75|nr:hypothetical protein [Rubrivivax gelatinosus]MBG6079027.1 hypothetical protein [Rubrivivax gelatinosus]
MSLPPLSHHEILALVAPLSRRGCRVDLAASDRLARRLVFRAAEHAATESLPAIGDQLELDCSAEGRFRLARVLTMAGARARLEAAGADAGELLDRLMAVAPQRAFSAGEGWTVARDYAVDGDGEDGLVLQRGVARIAGVLTLTLALPAVRRMSAELTLAATGGHELELPEDLLAVLGWNWAPLARKPGGWESRLRVPGSIAQRCRRAEAELDRAAAHLAQTLAEPPARYHERLAAARWVAAFRRAIPSLTAVALVATVALMPHGGDDRREPGLWFVLYHLPTLVLALSFCVQEMPRFEIPPLPRRSAAADWRRAPRPARA